MSVARIDLVRQGKRLNLATLGIVSLEAAVGLAAGAQAGSVALLGFGVDSLIELAATLAARWRLAADLDPARRERVEALSLRAIGGCFLALAAYVLFAAVRTLALRRRPEESRRDRSRRADRGQHASSRPGQAAGGARHGSGALDADAEQSALCGYLSAILLAGLLANASSATKLSSNSRAGAADG